MNETYNEIAIIHLSALYGGLLLVLFAFFLLLVKKGTEISREMYNPIAYMLPVVFTALIPFTLSPFNAVVETYRVIVPVVLFFIIASIAKNEKQKEIFSLSFLFIGTFLAMYNLSLYPLLHSGNGAMYSTWGYQNTYAAFMVLMSFTSFGYFLKEKREWKWIYLALTVLFNYSLFLTVSRGGELVYILAVIVFLITVKKRKRMIIPLITAWILSAVVIIIFAPRNVLLANMGKQEILVKFVEGTPNFSLWTRVHLADLSFRAFLKSPLTGYGMGSFRYIFALFEWTSQPFRVGPHSFFFRMLSETGIIGSVTIFTFFGYYFYKAYCFIREKNNYLFYGIFAGLFAFFSHMLIDVDIYPIAYILVFAFLALLIPYKKVKVTNRSRAVFAIIALVLIAISVFNAFPVAVSANYITSTEYYKYNRFNVMHAAYNPYYDVRYGNQNHFKEASVLFRKAVRVCPCSGEFKGALVSSLLNESSSNINEALPLLLNSSSNKYDYRFPLWTGWIYLYKDNYSIANAYFKKALKLYPSSAQVNAWLAISYYLIGNNKEGNKYWAEANNFHKMESKHLCWYDVIFLNDFHNYLVNGTSMVYGSDSGKMFKDRLADKIIKEINLKDNGR